MSDVCTCSSKTPTLTVTTSQERSGMRKPVANTTTTTHHPYMQNTFCLFVSGNIPLVWNAFVFFPHFLKGSLLLLLLPLFFVVQRSYLYLPSANHRILLRTLPLEENQVCWCGIIRDPTLLSSVFMKLIFFQQDLFKNVILLLKSFTFFRILGLAIVYYGISRESRLACKSPEYKISLSWTNSSLAGLPSQFDSITNTLSCIALSILSWFFFSSKYYPYPTTIVEE